MDKSIGKFQVFCGVMRSESTKLEGGERCGARDRVKKGRVGTQGEFQIFKGECLWIL